MPSMLIAVNVRRPIGNMSNRLGAIRYLIRTLDQLNSSNSQSDAMAITVENGGALGTGYQQQACAALTFSGGAGAMGATVAGTLVTTAFATSDLNTMNNFVAALRASTAVNRVVTATNRIMQATVGVVLAGQFLEVCGIPFTGVSVAAANFGEVDISSGVAATIATNTAAAINRHPSLCGKVVAVSNGATLTIGLSTDRSFSLPYFNIRRIATTITEVTKVPTLSTTCVIVANVPGQIGNEIRAAASGTGVTIATNGTAGLLGGGSGGGTLPYFFAP